MKKIFMYPVFFFVYSVSLPLQAQNSGEEIFKSVCAACHTIKMGRKVGPDLSGVYQIRSNEWLIRFIQSSQKFIKSGDTAAIAIYNEYNNIPMPDNNLSNEQVLSVIEYIRMSDQQANAPPGSPQGKDSLGSQALTAKATADSTALQFTPEASARGRLLFYGYAKFANGAPPCSSCHNINDESILGGGKLARDLTGSFVKLTSAGITAIMTNPPFPAMKNALVNHNLSADEINSLSALLKAAGEQAYTYKIRDSAGLIFFAVGFVLALFLFAILYLLYDYRKIPDSFT